MKEDEVYVATKNWFSLNGFRPIAGQPPNGCDNIPVIEIKSPINQDKGSKGSYKPDLVFASDRNILIVECKPAFSKADQEKLESIIGDEALQRSLADEMMGRKLLVKTGFGTCFSCEAEIIKSLRYCLTYSGLPAKLPSIATLCFSNMEEAIFSQPEAPAFLLSVK